MGLQELRVGIFSTRLLWFHTVRSASHKGNEQQIDVIPFLVGRSPTYCTVRRTYLGRQQALLLNSAAQHFLLSICTVRSSDVIVVYSVV